MKLLKRKPRSRRWRARHAIHGTAQSLAKVPTPSTNPATNLLIGDIALRGANMLAGRVIEKALLRLRYHPEKAADIVQGRTMVKSLAATGVARVATKSVPGFLLVSGGLLAKAVFDRTLGRYEAARRGDETLAAQADDAPES